MAYSVHGQETVLVVEDNTLIAEFIVAHLQASDYKVDVAESGERALELLHTIQPSLIVLDVVLDGIDGYEVCRRIRASAFDGLARIANVPVLMLTARAEMADRLDGFNAGVDDYMLKPFEPSELVARIKAILRRASGSSHTVLQVGKLTIDPRQRTAQADGVALELAPKEFDLLHLLASHPGQVMARATLLERVWGYSSDISTRTVDVHIQRLREKLAVHPECAQAIATEWGVGYRMVD